VVSDLGGRISTHPVATFFAVACVISWTAWSRLVFAEWWATWSPLVLAGELQTTGSILVGGFGPPVAAALVT
jgi:hypothetical protein